MKKVFVVDENVIYHAARKVNNRDEPDEASSVFLNQLAENCHKMILEKRIINKYFQIIDRLEREQNIFPIGNFSKFFHSVVKNREKWIQIPGEIPKLEDAGGISTEDVFLVENSNYSGRPIVSNDETLINELSVKENLDIEILTAKEAISLVSEE